MVFLQGVDTTATGKRRPTAVNKCKLHRTMLLFDGVDTTATGKRSPTAVNKG